MRWTDLLCSRWRSVVDVEVGGDAYSFGKIVHRLYRQVLLLLY